MAVALVLRRVISALLLALLPSTAAANCPLAPGRWVGSLRLELLAMRTDALTTAVSATISATMAFEVSCDGKMIGKITPSDDSEFRAIAASPSPLQQRCKLDFEYDLKEASVAKGAGDLPVLRIDVHIKGSHPRCTGELRKLMPSGLLSVGGLNRWRLEAIGQDPERRMTGGDRPWEMDSSLVSWFTPYDPKASYKTGGQYRWVLVRDLVGPKPGSK